MVSPEAAVPAAASLPSPPVQISPAASCAAAAAIALTGNGAALAQEVQRLKDELALSLHTQATLRALLTGSQIEKEKLKVGGLTH